MQRHVYDKLKRTITGSAMAMAVGVALLAPVVFGIASYRGEARYLANQNDLVVENLSRFIYRYPKTWVFQGERLGDVVSSSLFSRDSRVRVMDSQGNVVLTVGANLSAPTVIRGRTIVDETREIGAVETAVSLLPILLETLLVFIVSCTLGGGILIVLRTVPLRALGRAVERLGEAIATLEQSEVRLKEAQRIGRTGSWSYDISTRRMTWSREVERIFGLPAEVQPSIETILDAVHPEDHERAVDAFNRLTQMGHGLGIEEFRVIRPDWAVRYLQVDSEVQRKPDGEPIRVDGTFHDITELKTSEEKHRRLAVELARLSRRSSAEEMASGLARELKQLVAAITVCAHGTRQRLASQTASIRDVDESFDLILRHAAGARDAIGRVRWAGGEGEITTQDVDLNEIIRDAVDLVRSDAEARNVQVDLDLAGNLPRVTADPIQIAQVIVNLARSSVEAVAGIDCPRRMLRVSTGRKNGSRIWFRVEDAGLGIPDDARGQMFYPYVSTKSSGLGTGLLICQRIIEAHAGEFAVGDKVGGGIVASFTLPIIGQQGPADAGPVLHS